MTTKLQKISEYSEKGGEGKTSTTDGLAAVAGDRGMRVIVVDGDPRATATEELGVTVTSDTLTLNDLLYLPEDLDVEPTDPAEAIWDVLQPAGPQWPSTVRVIPAERRLANREADTRPFEGRLRMALAALEGEADIVFIDVPPRPGGKLVNTLLAATGKVLIPATLTTDGYAGIQHTLRTLKLIEAGGGRAPAVGGVVRNKIPRPGNWRAIHGDFYDLFEKHYSDMLLDIGDDDAEHKGIPEFAIREEAREASIPITAAPGREARKLTKYYGQVLDHILAGELESAHG